MATLKERVTSGAALKVSLPACDARTTTRPVPLGISVVAFSVAGPLTKENVTGNQELAEATSTSVLTSAGWSVIAKKSIY